ncbi:inhibin beta A chain-like [Biomphalaria glabrata]|uniref:Inhibin beta A chain-like n=1 Tax=Biomphalaria glabrata TaxID=6526 RepID=A0A9W3AI15_BIOGL|nr:inhibin beta A chain-like [Biomphalaria glabrata]XP_055886915.1 inhibin beta A chain-like [Biomphalaria glabrata]XP_055886916.1 inhibin beta A chain-like [Biomphalaria glabrata]
MKLRLHCSRCRAIYTGPLVAHPCHLLAVIAVLCAFNSRTTHSKVIGPAEAPRRTPESPYMSEEHLEAVADFKRRILRHVNLQEQSGVADHQTPRHNASIIRNIRDFMRSMRGNDSFEDVNQEPKKYIFPSSGQKKKDINKMFLKSLPMTTFLKSFIFHRTVKQPDDVYLELVMKSALLRMRIRFHKNQLQRQAKKAAKTFNVGVYLLRTSPPERAHHGEVIPLGSADILVGQNYKSVEIPLDYQKLSHIFDLEDNTLQLSLTIEEVVRNYNAAGVKRSGSSGKKRGGKAATPKVQVSKAVIEITTMTRDLNIRRDKRQVESQPCEQNKCCRHSIIINIKDIGWDNLGIHPQTVEFFYCKGSCPYRYKPKSDFSSIKYLLHSKIPNVVPAPVCAPTGYEPLDLILEKHNEIWHIPDMLVTGCMCY